MAGLSRAPQVRRRSRRGGLPHSGGRRPELAPPRRMGSQAPRPGDKAQTRVAADHHFQWATFARVWYLLDGKMQPPGKLAALASVRLQGLHKPVYHQLSEYHFRPVGVPPEAR
ncbi:MRPL13 [Cervus elaphus hippelaphus]|uniref:MRPL13 n=1 Tax=Cervus elaphus hippelaphus TaxID=46360 RepID=A0A212CEF6_CEREH|nr:MRPL13 [Cervus elaphus hippelaphus]